MIKVNSISTHFLCVCVHFGGIHLPVKMFPEATKGGELSNSHLSLGLPAVPSYPPSWTYLPIMCLKEQMQLPSIV